MQSIRHEIIVACTSTRHWSRTDNEHIIQLVEYKALLIECVVISFIMRCYSIIMIIDYVVQECVVTYMEYYENFLLVQDPSISKSSLFHQWYPETKHWNATRILPISLANPITVKPVYNDHLMQYLSAFWSSSRWSRATEMSSRRQKLLAGINWYFQASLKHITELITGNKSYNRGGRYRQVSLYLSKSLSIRWILAFDYSMQLWIFCRSPFAAISLLCHFPPINFVACT